VDVNVPTPTVEEIKRRFMSDYHTGIAAPSIVNARETLMAFLKKVAIPLQLGMNERRTALGIEEALDLRRASSRVDLVIGPFVKKGQGFDISRLLAGSERDKKGVMSVGPFTYSVERLDLATFPEAVASSYRDGCFAFALSGRVYVKVTGESVRVADRSVICVVRAFEVDNRRARAGSIVPRVDIAHRMETNPPREILDAEAASQSTLVLEEGFSKALQARRMSVERADAVRAWNLRNPYQGGSCSGVVGGWER
jgi:hypothetical protein